MRLHSLEANVPAGSTVLIQPYSVPLRQSRDGLVEALRATQGDEANASVRFQKQLALSPYPEPAFRTLFLGDGGLDADKIYISPSAFAEGLSLDPLRALGVQWVIVKRYNEPNPSLASFDRALRFRPVAAAGGQMMSRSVTTVSTGHVMFARSTQRPLT